MTWQIPRKVSHICKFVESRKYKIDSRTSWMFMHKVRKAMESSTQYPMSDHIEVDEFVVGGKETDKQGRSYDSKKKKIVCAVEYSKTGKVKRMYALKISSFSTKSIREIFDKHIDKKAKVVTDKWKAYTKLSKEYNIQQIKSEKGSNFKLLHTMIHQLKSWLRTIHSWQHEHHINAYLNEFCYRLNRSQTKDSIFDNLINRMMSKPIFQYKNIIIPK